MLAEASFVPCPRKDYLKIYSSISALDRQDRLEEAEPDKWDKLKTGFLTFEFT